MGFEATVLRYTFIHSDGFQMRPQERSNSIFVYRRSEIAAHKIASDRYQKGEFKPHLG